MLEVGTPAPPLQGPTDERDFDLAEFAGKPVVVYFYPKDMTQGCTAEAQGFRALHEQFVAAGASIVGVSRDTPARHEKFRKRESLPFELVSDEDTGICEQWGVWQEKKLYGRTYMGIERTTYLVDRDGQIAKAWPKVKVKGHAEDVLAAVQALG